MRVPKPQDIRRFVFIPFLCNLFAGSIAESASNSTICDKATAGINETCPACLLLPEECGWCKHDLPKQVNVTNRCNSLDELGRLGCIRIATKEEKAESCSQHGDKMCGSCHCSEGYFGASCQCESDAGVDVNNLEATCRSVNVSKVAPVCSGKGSCSCGRCQCYKRRRKGERIYGEYCQCDNFNCPRRNRKVCYGRGKCECGTCKCNPDSTGPACECPTSTTQCENADGEVCSGHGKCTCGICICDKGYGGLFCHIDTTKKKTEIEVPTFNSTTSNNSTVNGR